MKTPPPAELKETRFSGSLTRIPSANDTPEREQTMNTLSIRAAAYRGATLRGLQAMAAGIAIGVTACASTPPPTDDMAVSTAAVVHAANAGGAELAPTEMRAARDKLARANVAMAAEDYELARSLAHEAQIDARLAEAKAQSAKAGRAADALREDSRVLREELDRKAR